MGRAFQIVFFTFASVMLALLGWNLVAGAWTTLNWAMFAVSGICCLLAFVRFDHVFTFSYALAMSLNACLIASARPAPVAVLLAAIAVVYGVRLSTFTWLRSRSRSYAKHVDNFASKDAETPQGVKLMVWFATTLLYTFHAMPFYASVSQGVLTSAILLGALIMVAGLLLEAFADWQMQSAKSISPERFVNRGLFTAWRHPNYFGQMILQLGLITIGVSSVSTLAEVATASIAPIYIVVLMVFEARRRDKEQLERYGLENEYPKYRQNSGSLLPRFRGLS